MKSIEQTTGQNDEKMPTEEQEAAIVQPPEKKWSAEEQQLAREHNVDPRTVRLIVQVIEGRPEDSESRMKKHLCEKYNLPRETVERIFAVAAEGIDYQCQEKRMCIDLKAEERVRKQQSVSDEDEGLEKDEPEAKTEVGDDDPFSNEHIADPEYVPTKFARSAGKDPDALWKKIYIRIRNILLQTRARGKLLFHSLWELHAAQGYTGMDLGNYIMLRMDEDFEVGNDPELIWLKGVYQTTEMISAHV